MDDPAFQRLVTRLAGVANRQPRRYLWSVFGIALLGFAVLGLAIGFALLFFLLLAGFAVLVVATGGKALILLAKLGKLLVLLALPMWALVKSAFQMLFTRFPPPQGRVLTRAEAPRLFLRIDELRGRMRGPRVHTVLLNDQINAGIVQHPRFGLFGWERNYLILGLPLLQIMSEAEMLAVVAHEYGHLSGYHHRFGGFIYRFRLAWGRLQQLSEQWNDWGSRLIARSFRWYAPYFNAYTFVLARQNEYLADRASVEIAGRQPAAQALMRVDIAAQFEQEAFWPSIQRRVRQEAEPPANRSEFWEQSIGLVLDAPMRARLLDTACRRETNFLDTHPALRDRLEAIGYATDAQTAPMLDAPAISASRAWLGAHEKAIRKEFDRRWREDVAHDWQERHGYYRERFARLASLQTERERTLDQQWETLSLLDELHPDVDLLPHLDALLVAAPEHRAAKFRRGTLLLARGDAAGIIDLEWVMQRDTQAILPGCEAAWHYYRERDAERAADYAQRWQARTDHDAQVRAELRTLPIDAALERADDLEPAHLAQIVAILREHGKYIRKAYLLRRRLKSDETLHDHVLAFETRRFTLGNKGPVVAQSLAKQPFPVDLFVVHLASPAYRRFRKTIKRLGVAPLAY